MKVILDSDTLFALYVATDVHHQKARRIFQRLLSIQAELWVTSLVVQETATVISFRLGQKQAKEFLNRLRKIEIREMFMNQKLAAKAWQVFRKQEKKETSFVDCANIVAANQIGIKSIFSFDKIYHRMNLKPLKE